MKKLSKNENGFSFLEVLVVLVVVFLIGAFGLTVYKHNHGSSNTKNSSVKQAVGNSGYANLHINTQGWKKYTDVKTGLSFLYPVGSSSTSLTGVTGVGTIDPDLTSFPGIGNLGTSYTIEYPGNGPGTTWYNYGLNNNQPYQGNPTGTTDNLRLHFNIYTPSDGPFPDPWTPTQSDSTTTYDMSSPNFKPILYKVPSGYALLNLKYLGGYNLELTDNSDDSGTLLNCKNNMCTGFIRLNSVKYPYMDVYMSTLNNASVDINSQNFKIMATIMQSIQI